MVNCSNCHAVKQSSGQTVKWSNGQVVEWPNKGSNNCERSNDGFPPGQKTQRSNGRIPTGQKTQRSNGRTPGGRPHLAVGAVGRRMTAFDQFPTGQTGGCSQLVKPADVPNWSKRRMFPTGQTGGCSQLVKQADGQTAGSHLAVGAVGWRRGAGGVQLEGAVLPARRHTHTYTHTHTHTHTPLR